MVVARLSTICGTIPFFWTLACEELWRCLFHIISIAGWGMLNTFQIGSEPRLNQVYIVAFLVPFHMSRDCSLNNGFYVSGWWVLRLKCNMIVSWLMSKNSIWHSFCWRDFRPLIDISSYPLSTPMYCFNMKPNHWKISYQQKLAHSLNFIILYFHNVLSIYLFP